MNFSAQTERVGDGACVIAVSGEADLYTSPEFKRHVTEAIAGGIRSIVVDLTEATFIDSTALGVLTRARKRLSPAHGRIVVVVTDRNIRKVFEVTGLDRIFPLYESRDAALRNGGGSTSGLH